MTPLSYSKIKPAAGGQGGDPSGVAPYLLSLLLRNISTSSYTLADTSADASGGKAAFSAAGCVIASPSYAGYPGNVAVISQDYVYNWTRDGAITVSELLSAPAEWIPPEAATQTLADYITFADTCQQSDPVHLARGRYTIQGQITGWSDQSDGPALRILTILQGWGRLDDATKAIAQQVATRDLGYLLSGDPPAYQQPTVSHWEDTSGQSLFARSVQYLCFSQIIAQHPFGIDTTAAQAAATWLQEQIPEHWDAGLVSYRSLLAPVQRQPGNPPLPQYDPSIDPIMACLYGGGIGCTDPRLLATAAAARQQWTDPARTPYQINSEDAGRGIGPLMGRYVGDTYDGDVLNSMTGHPWAICTCNYAELYYTVADVISQSGTVPADPLAVPFFAQAGIADPATASVSDTVQALRAAGDSMLNAVLFHSDHLDLSEQFDQATGYEKSVSNLTWSYTSFLSALRVRNGLAHYPG